LTASSHAFGDQAAFIFGYRSTDLDQQLIMRMVTRRLIEKLDLASTSLKFFHEEHLVDVVAGQAIRGSH